VPNPQADPDRLVQATDHAIAACGGDARDALKALIVANKFATTAESMENEKNPDRSNVHCIARPERPN
jgi:hypothetical protein